LEIEPGTKIVFENGEEIECRDGKIITIGNKSEICNYLNNKGAEI